MRPTMMTYIREEPACLAQILRGYRQKLVAIETFARCQYLTDSLGDAFSEQWVACKLSELDWFERIVTREESNLA